jgi:CheY-like chemotaxis protein
MMMAGQRMTDMIDQLLDLTRARLAGGLGFVRVRKRIDIANLVQRTVEELRGTHRGREILVESSGDSTSTGDADRLLQLFSNLVANAIHHGTAGSSISVSVQGSDEAIAVSIANRGTIPAEYLPTIFDPFRGRQNKSSNSRGLGLGLFISQQIAVAHGGIVDLTTSGERGETVFTVRLPRRSLGPRLAAPTGKARAVLIVDDDENIRESLRDAFEEEGYEATTASNGQEALERMAHGKLRPDVVILDLVLPVIDGGRVYQAMQADAALASIPVIVSTSNPARAPSGVIVVPKPLKLDRLLDSVAQLCQGAE